MARPATLVFDDPGALHVAAAERIVRAGERAVAERGRFLVVLTGGTTVRPVYALLAGDPWRSRIAWDRTEVFFSDERCVPPDHPDSNFGMASAALLDKVVPIPCERIHRMRGEDPSPERAAIAYEQRIRQVLGLSRREAPRFDLVLLGMGADGHVASLFPGDPAVLVLDRLVVAVPHDGEPAPPVDRLSLTAPALSAGFETLFLVTGERKAAAVRSALVGSPDPVKLPVRRIEPVRPAVWLLDRRAAAGLAQP